MYPFKISPTIYLLSLTIGMVGCQGDRVADGSPQEESSEPPTNRIAIPPSVRNNLGITFARVERRKVTGAIRVPGAFELDRLGKHEYRAMLPGRIEFEVRPFQEIAKGDLLFRMRSPQWQETQASIDQAYAGLRQAQSKSDALIDRIAGLEEAGFRRADLEAQRRELVAEVAKQRAMLAAIAENAARTLSLHGAPDESQTLATDLLAEIDKSGSMRLRYQEMDWIEVRAAEKGVVASLDVPSGAFAEVGDLILTTLDSSRVRFHSVGLQSDIAAFQAATTARITPPQAQGVDINRGIEAELFLGLEANPDSRTVPLIAIPKEPPSWARPGITGFLEVSADASAGIVLAIPRSAIVKDGLIHVFFKRDPMDPNKAIRVEADMGAEDGRWVEISSELGPNDEVVLNGAYELKLASAQDGNVQQGGHFHADGTYHGEH